MDLRSRREAIKPNQTSTGDTSFPALHFPTNYHEQVQGTPTIDLTFPHHWQAEILAARPLILPPRHFTYPGQAEEVERGALEVMIHPQTPVAPGPDSATWESTASNQPPQLFLATCALGFRDPSVPTGLWSTPNPEEICAVSGGYAYLIHTTTPERFTMLPYRPVLEIRPAPADNLLLFTGHRSILAWGANGLAWESDKLSDEGLTLVSIANGILRGNGWSMLTDKEIPFALDLRTGSRAE